MNFVELTHPTDPRYLAVTPSFLAMGGADTKLPDLMSCAAVLAPLYGRLLTVADGPIIARYRRDGANWALIPPGPYIEAIGPDGDLEIVREDGT